MRWFRLRFHLISIHLLMHTILFCAVFSVEAKPSLRAALLSRQSWVPSWSSISSGMATLTSYLPTINFSPSLGVLQSPAFADLGAYLADTMPAFSDVYASIPSWEQWQQMLPNLPRPSTLFSQLPTEVQNGVQQMWSQMNPLDVEQYRRGQYRRGALMMLGLAGYYNGYQGMYKQYRKGIEAYIEPHQRKKKFNEMKRVCYYELPQEDSEDILEPSKIKAGMCSHMIVSHAKMGEHGNVILPMDQTDDSRLEQMLGDLKKAAPNVLLCVSGRSRDEFSPMAGVKHHRLKFIRSSVGLVRRYGLAGIDLDWEFSAMDSGTPQDAENMATLIEEFRDYMEPWVKKEKDEDPKKFILTATVSAMPQIISKSYDVKRLAKHLDWVNVMAYDYPMEQSGFRVMEHNAPLFDRSGRPFGLNVATTGMKWAQVGMPHEKIVIGLPLFGRSYVASPRMFRKRFGTSQSPGLPVPPNPGSSILDGPNALDERKQFTSKNIKSAEDLAQYAQTNKLRDTGFVALSHVPNALGSFPSKRTGSEIPFEVSSDSMIVPGEPSPNHEFPDSEEGHSLHNSGLLGGEGTIIGTFGTQANTPFDKLPSQANFEGDMTNAVGSLSSGPGIDGGFVPYGKICSMVSNGSLQVHMDRKARAPFATDGINWISFDDTVSVSIKSRWVEDMGFGGVALFNLNMDDWRGNCDPNNTPFQMLRAVWKMLG